VAGGDAVHARLPGVTLADEWRNPAPGGEQPSDGDSHRRLRDEGWPHQHRCRRRRDLRPALRRHRAPGPSKRPAIRHRPGTVRRSAPELGQDNEAILASIGYTTEQIADLAQCGVI